MFRPFYGQVFLSFAASGLMVSGAPLASPRIPFAFVRNGGQAAPDVRYIAQGSGIRMWFLEDRVSVERDGEISTLQFDRSLPGAWIEEGEVTGAIANYLHGNDGAEQITGLPFLRSITYHDVWQGVSIRIRSDSTGPKAEILAESEESLNNVAFRFSVDSRRGSGKAAAVAPGDVFGSDVLVYLRNPGEFSPAYSGSLIPNADGRASLKRGKIPKPDSILYGGYVGDSSQTSITAVAINASYNTIVAGWTNGSDLPASAGAQKSYAGGVDAFVAGFSATGGSLLFCTYLGGTADDRAFGVAVDSSNNIYVTGWTSSTNFPVVNAYQNKLKGARDAFVTKLNSTGSALLYSTYLGGSGVDFANAIMVDSTGTATLIGDTTSSNLPVSAGAFQNRLAGVQDAFVAQLSPNGNTLKFLTYYGGSGTDHGAAIRPDLSGNYIIGGNTYSYDLPAVLAFQPQNKGGQDGFVARISVDGGTLMLSTYVGGSGGSPGAPEQVTAVAVGGAGLILFAGTTSSTDFPVISYTATQIAFGGGNTDGFVGRIDPATGVLTACTFFGGSGDDGVAAMVSDPASWIYITGYTNSTDFPTVRASQPVNAGLMDGFVAKLTFGRIFFSTYLGGAASDGATSIAIDSMTNVVVAGTTQSANFPASGNVGRRPPSVLSSFLTKISPNFTLGLGSAPTILEDVWHDTGLNGTNINLLTMAYGSTGDIPITGDWNGTGTREIGVFRAGMWILDTNGNGALDSADKVVYFGQSGDIPVIGDWNGSGRIKLGLFRQGTFILDLSGHLLGPTGLSDRTFAFGLPGDRPVVGDWNSTGISKVGVFRSGQWLVDYNGDGVFNSLDKTFTYGQVGDIPVVGDWSGSGIANQIGVYRAGLWILNAIGNNVMLGNGQRELYAGFGGPAYSPLIF